MSPGSQRRLRISSPASITVFTTVLTQGPVSRVEVCRRTGLSSAAVTKVTRPLIEAGYLEEQQVDDPRGGVVGRPPSPLVIHADKEFFLGIKITADSVVGVVTDLRAQVRTVRHRRLTTLSVEQVMAAITELVADLLAASPVHSRSVYSLGLAIAGDVDRTTGFVRYSPFLGWRDVPLGELAQKATGLVTTVENDVKALTTAEQWFGAGLGTRSFALITVGAGIGCGLVINGEIVAGAYGVAGEIGHLPVVDGEPPCHCGGRGCVETIASEAAILERVRQVTGAGELTMADAVEQARNGDTSLREVFARAGHAIGLGLAVVANLVGPERIIVSGEGLAAYDLFEEQIRKTFARQAFGAAAQCTIIIRALPFEEWARGAAAVAIQALLTPEPVDLALD